MLGDYGTQTDWTIILRPVSFGRQSTSATNLVTIWCQTTLQVLLPADFLTGFMKETDTDEAYGRPTAIAELSDGTLLVVDDDGETIWSVQPSKR